MARKILLADDSVTAQNMGRKILADAGYEVIAVNNGSAALKKIAELKPDLVILDVYMPGYSGLEVCQRLKESQDTARIPVLLSVGKLEPFKPEEAQRVKADGYIVKPFEASELLSALSKLEDKVVPRAEPSKPGRFARAMKAAEESDRGSRNEPSTTETGWKNRISFPHQKTEAEEKVADEVSSSGPTDRDSNTVTKANVDVAAFAPIGVPKEVRPEEVAAIAAAAAQIQIAGAAKDAQQASEQEISETASRASLESYLDRVEGNAPVPHLQSDLAAASGDAKMESSAGSEGASKIDSPVGDFATAEMQHRRNGDEKPEEPQDVPVTIAATAESASAGASRWKAVSVALEGEEAATSLEHEMHKAYAAFAAADYVTSAGSVEAEAASDASASLAPEAQVEAPLPTISKPPHELVPESQPERTPELTVSPEPEAPATVQLESTPAETHTETLETAELARREDNPPAIAEFASSEPVADPAAREARELPESESATAGAANASTSALAPVLQEPGVKVDSETVKSTAAAWASWRQVRDISKDGETAQTEPREFEAPESAPAERNAKAVAAGAEQILQQVSEAAQGEKPADVASIVDSVLADLRPKLMEEISRKMAEKK